MHTPGSIKDLTGMSGSTFKRVSRVRRVGFSCLDPGSEQCPAFRSVSTGQRTADDVL